MNLFVLMQKGRPFQLPVADAETSRRLDDLSKAEHTFAFASTNREHVDNMRQALPDMLDADDDMGLYIALYACTKYTA